MPLKFRYALFDEHPLRLKLAAVRARDLRVFRLRAFLRTGPCEKHHPHFTRHGSARSSGNLRLPEGYVADDLDRLAEKGAVFNDAVAVSPWTRPSNATLLTGVYPLQHGARTFRSTLSADVPSLPELLAPAGFRCAAIVSSMLINERSGLDRGFEFFRYVSEWQRLPGGSKRSRDPGTRVTREAIEWLDANAESRFFLFLHYYDALPQAPPSSPLSPRSPRAAPYSGAPPRRPATRASATWPQVAPRSDRPRPSMPPASDAASADAWRSLDPPR